MKYEEAGRAIADEWRSWARDHGNAEEWKNPRSSELLMFHTHLRKEKHELWNLTSKVSKLEPGKQIGAWINNARLDD